MAGVLDFFEDPLGYVSGINKGGWTGSIDVLKGNPGQIKQAYDDMMAKAQSMTADTRNFLSGQEGKALKFYQPVQGMFNSMYGTGGIQAPQVPQAAGQPFSRTLGAR